MRLSHRLLHRLRVWSRSSRTKCPRMEERFWAVKLGARAIFVYARGVTKTGSARRASAPAAERACRSGVWMAACSQPAQVDVYKLWKKRVWMDGFTVAACICPCICMPNCCVHSPSILSLSTKPDPIDIGMECAVRRKSHSTDMLHLTHAGNQIASYFFASTHSTSANTLFSKIWSH